eukprot:8056322-Lingulodinium_polyedra.AAC.1
MQGRACRAAQAQGWSHPHGCRLRHVCAARCLHLLQLALSHLRSWLGRPKLHRAARRSCAVLRANI